MSIISIQPKTLPAFLKQLCFISCLFLFTSNLPAQLITTIAGNGTAGFSGDGGPALNAQLNIPVAVCFDSVGNMFIADYGNQRVRKIDAVTGLTSTVAGNGTTGFSGDGGLAINAQLNHPAWLVADNLHHLYITDFVNLRVRRVDLLTGIITTIAGDGTENYVNGARADQTGMLPSGLAFDNYGDLYISQHPGPFVSYTTNIISKIDKLTGIITTVAGNGQFTFAGDGGPALQASFFYPMGMCFDAANNLYVADNLNQRIRKIDAVSHIVTTVAGDGSPNRNAPDGTQAVNVGIANPSDVKMDAAGDFYYVDFNDERIRKVTVATGDMSTIAGVGSYGFGSDCVSPTSTVLGGPRVAAFDSKGNLCFTDQDFHRIRSIIAGTTASIVIAPSTSDVCLQNVVTFSSYTTGTNLQSVYQWKKNGVDVGNNSATYTDTFHKNDVVVCILTPGTCSNNQIASNPYTVTGTFEVTPVVSITATDTDICLGNNITFTASNVSGSLDPAFEWYVNKQLVLNTTPVYSSNLFNNGDTIQCIMRVAQCNGGTTEGYSNAIGVRVYTALHPSITIQGLPGAICKGALAVFNATTLQAGNAPLYQWKVNGHAVGTNSDTLQTSLLADGDVVSCDITTTDIANACLPLQTVGSNTIKVQVQQPANLSLQIVPLQPFICQGDSIQIRAVTTPPVAGNIYTWQLNNSSVSGINLFTIRTPANGDLVSCSIPVTGCTISSIINSNILTLSVKPLPVVSLRPADTTVSAGTQLQLQAFVAGTSFTYSWNPVDKLQSVTTLTPVTIPLQTSAVFQLQVTSADGCIVNKETIARVTTKLYMPAAFSPNSDGKNDLFRIPPSVSFQLEVFSVFDRWGNKLFTTADISKGWDGRYKGIALQGGAYIYLVTGRDSHGLLTQKGSVILMR